MTRTLWLSTERMTFTVDVDLDSGRIVDSAPIARKFIGQPVANIERWLKRFGGYRAVWL